MEWSALAEDNLIRILVFVVIIAISFLLGDYFGGRIGEVGGFKPGNTITKTMCIGFSVLGVIGMAIVIDVKDLNHEFTEEERLVIDKSKEVLGAKKIYFKEDSGSPIYFIVVSDKDYVVEVSSNGVHVEGIYHDGEVVYQATEDNIDEGLTDLERIATRKIREVTGHDDVKVVGEIARDKYRVKSGDKLYEVGLIKDENHKDQVEYIIHNDQYLFNIN